MLNTKIDKNIYEHALVSNQANQVHDNKIAKYFFPGISNLLKSRVSVKLDKLCEKNCIHE